MNKFDVIIIGAGPAGYHAASIAAEHKSVLLIEKTAVGGTCLNWGCIPTKTLLYLAKEAQAVTKLKNLGMDTSISYKHQCAITWKNEVVEMLKSGISKLLQSKKVTIVEGEAEILSVSASEKKVKVGSSEYLSNYLIIASGSQVWTPPVPIKNTKVYTAKEILDLETLPKNLCIVGAGVIGIEFANLFSALGVRITLIDVAAQTLPNFDVDVAKIAQKQLEDTGVVQFYLGAKIEGIENNVASIINADNKPDTVEFDTLLISTGVKNDTSAFEKLGIACSKLGIETNEYMQTNIPKLYAIGDVVGTSQLAHSAYRMAEVAVGSIISVEQTVQMSSSSGEAGVAIEPHARMRYNAIPKVVYSYPECASIGKSQKELEDQQVDFIKAQARMILSGRSLAEQGKKSPGFCKILANKKNGVILGLHIVGPYASEIISVGSLILEHELRVQDVAEMIFPHPSISELIPQLCNTLKKQLQ